MLRGGAHKSVNVTYLADLADRYNAAYQLTPHAWQVTGARPAASGGGGGGIIAPSPPASNLR